MLYDLFVECYNEFVTEGYYKKTVDNTEALDRLARLNDSETELTLLMTRGVINQNQYLEEQQRIRFEMQSIQENYTKRERILFKGATSTR